METCILEGNHCNERLKGAVVLYKKAFQCKKCPESNEENGCPCWLELVWTNDDTGQAKVDKGCFFQKAPLLMLESVKSGNQASEHASQMRNGFMELSHLAQQKMALDSQERGELDA